MAFVLADKPPIEELHQFLEFQLPRQWAPVFSELPLGPQRKQQCTASLKFSLMGPKLFVNTNPVKLFRLLKFLAFYISFLQYHFHRVLVCVFTGLDFVSSLRMALRDSFVTFIQNRSF